MESIELQQIIDFVEGRLPAEEFEQILYANPRFEEVMGYDTYMSAITRSYKTIGDGWNAQSFLTKFLRDQGIIVSPTPIYQELFETILKAQPAWLYANDDYVQNEILPHAAGRVGSELEQWLREEFLKRFRYISQPPEWVQGPNWPINENGPMTFMGQIPVLNFWHDEGAIYVFYDRKSGIYKNISQVY